MGRPSIPFTHDPASLELRPRSRFCFRAFDLSSDAITGQAGTFSRNSIATIFDRNGAVIKLPSNVERWSAFDSTGSGIRDKLVYRLERAATNLVLQSENFGTTWTATNSPTRTAAAKMCGQVALDLIGDNSGSLAADYRQSFAFTGTGLKGISLFVAQGTVPPAGGSSIVLVDTTAGNAVRLQMLLTWNSDGTPAVAQTTGTLLAMEPCTPGVYRLHFITTSATTVNSHSLRISPANTAAQSGNLYCGGVQAENTSYPTSYIPTTTVVVTRNAETKTFPLGWMPSDCTAYLEFARPFWQRANAHDLNVTLTTAERRLLEFGGGTLKCAIRALTTGDTYAGISDGTFVNGTSTDAGSVASLRSQTITAQFKNMLTGTEGRLAYEGAAFTAWNTTTKVCANPVTNPGFGTTPLITLGGGSTELSDIDLIICTIASGLKTRDQVRYFL